MFKMMKMSNKTMRLFKKMRLRMVMNHLMTKIFKKMRLRMMMNHLMNKNSTWKNTTILSLKLIEEFTLEEEGETTIITTITTMAEEAEEVEEVEEVEEAETTITTITIPPAVNDALATIAADTEVDKAKLSLERLAGIGTKLMDTRTGTSEELT